MILPQSASFDPSVVKLMPRRWRPHVFGRYGGSLFGIFLLGVMVLIIAAITGFELFWLAMASATRE